MAGEGDLVGELGLGGVDAGGGGGGEDFAAEEGVDGGRVQQRNLLRMGQLRGGVILHHARAAGGGLAGPGPGHHPGAGSVRRTEPDQ